MFAICNNLGLLPRNFFPTGSGLSSTRILISSELPRSSGAYIAYALVGKALNWPESNQSVER